MNDYHNGDNLGLGQPEPEAKFSVSFVNVAASLPSPGRYVGPNAKVSFGGASAVSDHEAIEVDGIGNYYGGLSLKREQGVDYWSIEDYTGHNWVVCDPAVAAAIRALKSCNGGDAK